MAFPRSNEKKLERPIKKTSAVLCTQARRTAFAPARTKQPRVHCPPLSERQTLQQSWTVQDQRTWALAYRHRHRDPHTPVPAAVKEREVSLVTRSNNTAKARKQTSQSFEPHSREVPQSQRLCTRSLRTALCRLRVPLTCFTRSM